MPSSLHLGFLYQASFLRVCREGRGKRLESAFFEGVGDFIRALARKGFKSFEHSSLCRKPAVSENIGDGTRTQVRICFRFNALGEG